MYQKCLLCPNECGVDRTKAKGVCGQGDKVMISWAGLHKGEEPPITGKNGSGMIFFSGCTLHCAYCQNYQISKNNPLGFEVSDEELSLLMLSLQDQGATTLNLVTGTHFIPSIINAIIKAKRSGLSIPIVWNSSGYESISALELIDPYIDLYLLDVKTLDKDVASKFCGKKQYVDNIIPLMDYLTKKHPVCDLDNLKGILVRHLVFPYSLDATLSFLKVYGKKYKDNCFLSLMVQFISPLKEITFPQITESEYDLLLDSLNENEIEDGFIQERGDETLWLPDFRKDNPFLENYAKINEYFLSLRSKRMINL